MFPSTTRQGPEGAAPPRLAKWPRAAAVVAVSLVTAGLTVTVGTRPGLAVDGYTEVACPSDPNFLAAPVNGGKAYYYLDLLNTSQGFIPGFGEFQDNDTAEPRTVTFTVTKQNTVSTKVTHVEESTTTAASSIKSSFGLKFLASGEISASFTEALKRSTSKEVTNTAQTTVGVTTQFTVPAHTKVLGQRGFDSVDANVNVQVIFRLDSDPSKCYKSASEPDFHATTSSPTINEGWRFTETPYPKITNVVDSGSAMAEFTPGSVVSAQGDFFAPPDQLLVTQGGNTRTIETGSNGWKDFESEIKGQLPFDLEPGPVQIKVRSGGNLTSAQYTVQVASLAPRINVGGVLNPDAKDDNGNWTPENMQPGKMVSIFGTLFTPGRDTVQITQNGHQYTVGAGSTNWYDGNGQQINAQLPADLQPGAAQVQVKNATGRLSGMETINVVDPRPRVDSVLSPNVPQGRPWSAEELQPSTPASIFGDRFRPGEDKVVIEQGDRTHLLQAGSPGWYDSANQINMRLPSDLQAGQAKVYVRHTKGISEPATVNIVDVAPQISPNGVLNPAAEDPFGNWTANNIKPGTVVVIFGSHFTPDPGDKVRVSQGGNQWTVQAGSTYWYDSANQINVKLPTGLQLGSAQVQVMNVNGRVSEPASITIVS